MLPCMNNKACNVCNVFIEIHHVCDAFKHFTFNNNNKPRGKQQGLSPLY